MAEEAIVTPEVEVKTPEKVEKTTAEVTTKVDSEQTISEMVKETEPEEKINMIPESVFLGEKKARKQAEKELKALKESIQEGASQEEISQEIDEIAEEHDIDKKFLRKLASTIKAEAEKELDAKYSSKFKNEDKQEKFETVFNKAYDVAIERAPEFKAIANPTIIKSLSLLPENSKKTLSQILEETYGNAITGKRTMETTSPAGGKDPEPLDYVRAKKDTEYFKEIMSDPKKKAQYNERMIREGF